ncbi:MAG: hypothetical protein QOF48_2622 [Verrucomicrobiota bacterium]|jgi:hypothetical protein
MKKFLRLQWRLAALVAAGLALHTGSVRAQLAPPTPVGTWDLSLSGSQVGLSLITFNDDFTFTGVQYLRPGPVKSTSTTVDPRFPGGIPTRTGVEPVQTPAQSSSNFIGSTEMSGIWTYDDSGRVIGLLNQVTASIQLVEKTVTNAVTTSSVIGGITVITTNDVVSTTNVYENVFRTNAVSFRASVVANKRLSLVSYQSHGRVTYVGTPSLALADASGNYFLSGKRGALPYVEFLTLTPNAEFPGEYTVTGSGAGYGFTGFAFPSRHNQIAVYMQSDREPYPITVLTGSFNIRTLRGSLIGKDTSGNRYTARLIHQ